MCPCGLYACIAIHAGLDIFKVHYIVLLALSMVSTPFWCAVFAPAPVAPHFQFGGRACASAAGNCVLVRLGWPCLNVVSAVAFAAADFLAGFLQQMGVRGAVLQV